MPKAVWNDTVLAQSGKYKMVEGNVYFPSESVNWDYLSPGDRQYTCPWKGKSVYYNVKVDGEVLENAAWAYPEPKPAALYIKGFVAFETGAGIEVVD
jgi:uncharacterized protein (DUF427 family)